MVLVLSVIIFALAIYIVIISHLYEQDFDNIIKEAEAAQRKADQYQDLIEEYEKQLKMYKNHIYTLEQKEKCITFPKGTVEALAKAVKDSHPDNGGNPEEFQMYLRAYRILTGKEKM